MQRASDIFTNEQRRKIDQAVADAESKTSAELVPVVATASGRYDRAEDIIGLWCAMLAAVSLWIYLPRTTNTGSWGEMSLVGQIVTLIGVMALSFIIGAVVGSRIGWLRRLFTAQQEMRDEVAARAREIFFDQRVHHTRGATGMLLYVSLLEHTAAVIADQQVLDKLGQPVLDELCAELTEALRRGHPAEALRQVIASAGDRLEKTHPRQENDVNELSDALVTID